VNRLLVSIALRSNTGVFLITKEYSIHYKIIIHYSEFENDKEYGSPRGEYLLGKL